MSLELSEDEFESIVVDELDALPDEMVEGLENLVFVTEARPEDGSLDLLGVYEGVALTDRVGHDARSILLVSPTVDLLAQPTENRAEVTLLHLVFPGHKLTTPFDPDVVKVKQAR